MDENLKQILNWNEKNPIGTFVRVTRSNGVAFIGITTSVAKFLGDIAVIWVNRGDGCQILKDVEAI